VGGRDLRLSGWAVFDLDGTLVDTLGEIASALNRVLRKHGRAVLEKDIVRDLVGKGPRTLVERAWLRTGIQAEEKRLEGYMLEYLT
jgi:phosphoglycolate phosphatase